MVKVMQCWDDGVVTDLRLIELLRKHEAKATFNLNPAWHGETRAASSWAPAGYTGWSYKGFLPGKLAKHELLDVYSGFQVASHCMRHETAGTLPDADFLKAALDARRFLEDLFQRPCRGFAWPCGKYTRELADAMLAEGFAYGRTTENSEHVIDSPHPMILRSSGHFANNNFYECYEKAKQENGIFYFWGHSYEMMDSEGMWNQLELKLKFLRDEPDAVWCDLADIDWKNLCGKTRS